MWRLPSTLGRVCAQLYLKTGEKKMKCKSREITYRKVVEQVFFDDDSELIIKTGWAEGQFGEFDLDIAWATPEPEWAKGMTPQQLDDIATEDKEKK
jgi:hypothetical protein